MRPPIKHEETMKQLRRSITAIIFLTSPLLLAKGGKDYLIKPVPFNEVRIQDSFWSPRLEINLKVTLWHIFNECATTGRFDNFAIAAGLKKGKYTGYQFNDSDVYKSIEGAAYILETQFDARLDKYLDSLITIIAAAQDSDGYLYTPRRLMTAEYQPPGGKDRWVGEKDGSHELYCAGHLYEAAVAHFLATGKKNLLSIALRNADLVCATFGPNGRHEVPGHQEIEIGLSKLYRLTENEKYLETAKFFLDQRGNAKGHELMGDYAQDDKPIREQDLAEGHSVRAAYMYSGMADVAALSGDESYMPPLDRIWRDVVSTKMYVTGGIGASGGNEGFSHAYALPNSSAYCETCASIANALWNYRMFLAHADAKYVDVMERTIYNSFLSGISMDGQKFFYPNPLESFHGASRSEWFGCACCPPNVLRFLPSLAGYIYAHDEQYVYVNLFIGSETDVKLGERIIHVKQQTHYPWEGTVRLSIDPDRTGRFGVKLRVPGWTQNQPVPSDLYYFADSVANKSIFKVNGHEVAPQVVAGFADIDREWRKGDVIELEFPMQVRRVMANPSLLDDKDHVSLQRGPIVFCLEGVDTKDKRVTNLILADNSVLKTEFQPNLLNGVQTISGTATPVQRTLEGGVVLGNPEEFLAVPYYAWAHRGRSEMTVWVARENDAAQPAPAPTLAYTSKASASDKRNAEAINDQLLPKNSNDQSIPYLHWWPIKGTSEWVQYDFPKSTTISRSEVYWFDDTGTGECRLPKSWRLLYLDDGKWKLVENSVPYSIGKDTINTIQFKSVTTTALKLEVQLIPDYSAGIYEWSVE
jgi:DUF1680 family protein